MKYVRFNAIIDIKLDKGTYDEILSWQEEVHPVNYLSLIHI